MNNIRVRPPQPDDLDLLLKVYASTRADEMALVPWSAEQKDAFVLMQFNAQRQSYRVQFPEAEYEIILRDDAPVGRRIISRTDERILLIDIALLPPYRNLGIGTALMRQTQKEAAEADKPLRLHVEIFNPAQRLYERLGFYKVGESGIYYELEWRPIRNG